MSSDNLTTLPIPQLAQKLEIGDIVFTRIDILPFRKVANDTGSWTNHVGIVIDTNNKEPVIAESTFPFSTKTKLSKFVNRSENGRVAIKKFIKPLSEEQKENIIKSAHSRLWKFYDTGFNLYSNRQFCSRYVREIVEEATAIKLGKIENLHGLFAENPNADMFFWKVWYFGKIPWQRETVTPASILNDHQHTQIIFDGYAKKL